ncbi:pentapeptide repeat-containing protein [Streptomyces sp. M2CJ-2]|uniref:pentapeptide repeat-containing protein n=1 Tax=Streptomyces sp. M2CJ-2 TaxID=2803948 RepID=UPI0019262C8B|nr:pentapeptide repeat-containing protein [Streptomyces sp. M2CJ-2]MBL3671012.1 pentapeptide repeat-containing protein [Streptomyces sp. M2CJ-2]
MSTPPLSAPGAPSWPYCAHGADPAADPVGCRGVHVPGHTACLAHLAAADRDAYLAALSPGADIDHRGTLFTEDLLNRLLAALTDSTTGRPRIGNAWLSEAEFSGDARFDKVQVGGEAWFTEAEIGGEVRFDEAEIGGDVRFGGAQIGGDARFTGAQIGDDAWFDVAEIGGEVRFDEAKVGGGALFGWVEVGGDARFSEAEIGGEVTFGQAEIGGLVAFGMARIGGDVWFSEAQVHGNVGFGQAQIGGDAWFPKVQTGGISFPRTQIRGEARFEGAQIRGDARFDEVRIGGTTRFDQVRIDGALSFHRAVLERAAVVGPLMCGGVLELSEAVFERAVAIEAAAAAVHCRRTRWASTAALRLRHAEVDLSDAVVEYPVSVSAHARPFTAGNEEPAEPGLTDPRVRVMSLRGVDAAHLVLTDVDLTDCRFAGTIHLDQLRLEGRCRLATAPAGLRRRGIWPVRWTPRQTLAEEQHWRATRRPADGWTPAPQEEEALEPVALEPVYRQLRKAFEDGKNEPGAADFYYGEMEMRRHDRTGTTRAERGLLHGYWLLSGYGLRASRALGWLASAMLLTIVLLMGFGLPEEDPKQEATGTVPLGGGTVTFEIDKTDPQNPTGDRFTGRRFEKALNVTLNSVVFRSSGQDLTTAGTYIEMTSRLVEPALLALAVLAVRGRVKR